MELEYEMAYAVSDNGYSIEISYDEKAKQAVIDELTWLLEEIKR